MASGWFLASDASSVAASCAAWSSCMILLCSELPTPSRYALCTLLSASGSWAGSRPKWSPPNEGKRRVRLRLVRLGGIRRLRGSGLLLGELPNYDLWVPACLQHQVDTSY